MQNLRAILTSLALVAASSSNAFSQEKAEPKTVVQVDSLELAYQKELVYLRGQKKLLEERLRRQEQLNQRNMGEIEAQLRALEEQSFALKEKKAKLEDEINSLQVNISSFDQSKLSLENTLLQAGLEDIGEQNLVEAFETSASKMLASLASMSDISRQEGEFFLSDGALVTGQITRLGQLAAFGSSEKGGGALVPAGESRLKVWNNPSQQALMSLEEQTGETFATYIFDPKVKQTPDPKIKTLMDTIEAGGMIGLVILALGAVAILLVTLKAIFLKMAQLKHDRLAAKIGSCISEKNLEKIASLCEQTGGASSSLVRVAIENLSKSKDAYEDAVAEGYIEESNKIDRFSTFIIVVATVAPLLGLLGTVTGMISTFDIITEFGAGDPKLLSSGISEALVTTMLGLIVAIPSLLLGNMLSSWGESLKSEMEKLLLQISNSFNHG